MYNQMFVASQLEDTIRVSEPSVYVAQKLSFNLYRRFAILSALLENRSTILMYSTWHDLPCIGTGTRYLVQIAAVPGTMSITQNSM
jgi:hypothetical protein